MLQDEFLAHMLELTELLKEDDEPIGPMEVQRFFESRVWLRLIESVRNQIVVQYRITADPIRYDEDVRKVASGRIAGLEWLLHYEEVIKEGNQKGETK